MAEDQGSRTAEILAELRAEIESVPRSELPSIIGLIESVKAEAFARLVTPPSAEAETDDRLLTVDEVASALGMTSRWVRDHASKLPRVKLPGRSLRFSGKRLAALVKRRREFE